MLAPWVGIVMTAPICEAVDHGGDQRAIARANKRRHVDAMELLAHLFGREGQRLAGLATAAGLQAGPPDRPARSDSWPVSRTDGRSRQTAARSTPTASRISPPRSFTSVGVWIGMNSSRDAALRAPHHARQSSAQRILARRVLALRSETTENSGTGRAPDHQRGPLDLREKGANTMTRLGKALYSLTRH